MNLHQLWDGLITSSSNLNRLSQIATELLARFSKVGLRELDTDQAEGWAKESYEIATKIAYEGGGLSLDLYTLPLKRQSFINPLDTLLNSGAHCFILRRLPACIPDKSRMAAGS